MDALSRLVIPAVFLRLDAWRLGIGHSTVFRHLRTAKFVELRDYLGQRRGLLDPY